MFCSNGTFNATVLANSFCRLFFPHRIRDWWMTLWLHAMNTWRAAEGTEDEWIASLHQYVHTHRTHWLPCGIYNFNIPSPVTGCLQAFLPTWPSPLLPGAWVQTQRTSLPFLYGHPLLIQISPYNFCLLDILLKLTHIWWIQWKLSYQSTKYNTWAQQQSRMSFQ